MELGIILNGEATVEDLCMLSELGFSFVVNNGLITEIIPPDAKGQR